MRRWGRREPRPDLPVAPGERLLAWASTTDGEAVGGTREAVYVGGVRLPWEQVEAADWDRDTSVLRIVEVGHWGDQRAEHVLTIDEPGRLLEMLRERVTASVVLQRHVPIAGRRGVRVIARRPPSGGPLLWVYEYDEGVDPDDPAVRLVAEEALAAARDEVGLD